MKLELMLLKNQYMKWYDNDSFRDFNMAIDSGYMLLAASMIQEVFDPKHSYEPEIEREILKLLKKYGKRNLKRDRAECFDNAIVYVNPETNEHAFISNGYVDYLMDSKEMREMGYIDADDYYSADCKDCWKAMLEGYTKCGECSVPYCGACGAMSLKQCNCGPIAAND